MSSPTPAPNHNLVPNHWNTYDNPEIFEWRAQLPVAGGPAPLLRLQRTLFDAGERHQILRIDASPDIDYERTRDGYIGDFVDAHPDRPGPLDEYPAGFILSGYWQMRYSTRLAYAPAPARWAAGDRVEEDWFDGTAELGERSGIPVRWSTPPVQLFADADERRFLVALSLMTDIFFPLNPAADDRPGTDEVQDNRALAERNGTRLNAFFADLRHATLAAGGTWDVPPLSASRPWRFDEHGIVFQLGSR